MTKREASQIHDGKQEDRTGEEKMTETNLKLGGVSF